ncbi:MAG TPA: hypothetical protein VGD99_02605 [Anaerolineae bacterium]
MHALNSVFIAGLILGLLAACGGSNAPLQANAGTNFSINVGESPTFDGCASTGEIANYKWTIVSAPDMMSDDAGKVIREVDANCSFALGAAMGVDEVGPWLIELEVRGAEGNTSTDQVQVEVGP